MKTKNLTFLVAATCCSASHVTAELTHRYALNETELIAGTPPTGILESVSGSTSAALFGTTTGVLANPGVSSTDLSYQFNGSNNGVSTTLTNVLPTVADFSVFVTARFAQNYQGGARMLFSNNSSQAGRLDFGVSGTPAVPNELTFFLGGSPANMAISFADSTSSPILFDGSWHEVGISRSGTTFQLYVDGVAVGSSGTSSVAISTGTNYLIGRRVAFSGFFNNSISEVQVFNDARTEGLPILLNDPPSELTPYEQWALDNGINPFAAGGGPNDDYDLDGSLNIEEFESLTSVTINRDANGAITGTTPFTGSSDPADADSQPDEDEDGLPDGWEYFFFLGLFEAPDADRDEDTYTNWQEFLAGSDPTNALSTPLDTDADGLPDAWEIQFFGNLAQGPDGDFDGDDISNLNEYLATRGVRLVRNEENGSITDIEQFTGLSDPANPDSQPDEDGDGLPDGWETRYFGSLDQGSSDDFDGDGFTNLEELLAGSNPARLGNTPENVNDTVAVAVATAAGLDEWSVTNDVWTKTRTISPGIIDTVIFHNNFFYGVAAADVVKIDPVSGTRTVLATRNTGPALSAGWTDAGARDIELGPDGKLYYTTTFNASAGQGVFRLNLDGSGFERFIARSGGSAPDNWDLNNSIGLVWHGNDLYVSSRGAFGTTNRSIYLFDASGNFIRTFINTLTGPMGLCLDGSELVVGGSSNPAALVSLKLSDASTSYVKSGFFSVDVINILGELHSVTFNSGTDGNGSILKAGPKAAMSVMVSNLGSTGTDLVTFELSSSPYATWAAGFGLDPESPEGAPTGDFDGDGTSNQVEFLLGLDPTTGTSLFATTGSGAPTTGITLTWPSAAGISFQVRSSVDLTDWSTLEATVIGAVGETTASWTSGPQADPKKFFRVEFTSAP